jgi:hypothetical protein
MYLVMILSLLTYLKELTHIFLSEQAHNLAMLNPRLEAALKKCAVSKDSTVPVKNDPLQDIEASKPAPPPVNAGLKGVSQSLIDKVL